MSAYSDARLKTSVATISGALDKVLAMRGVSYTVIKGERRSSGLIAQELREVAPELVTEDDEGMLAVAYGNVVGYLIEAIRELTIKVEKLEANR